MSAKIINRVCLLAVAALTLCVLLLQGCADVLSADSTDWHAAPPHAPTPAPASLSNPANWAHQSPLQPSYSPQTFRMEELILFSDVIARVRLLEVDDYIDTNLDTPNIYVRYGAELWSEFEVLEYLKGDGSSRIWGVTIGSFHRAPTKEKARDMAKRLRSMRDTRWDAREAIVFLYDENEHVPSTIHPDRYWMSMFLEGKIGESHSLGTVGGWFPMLRSDRAPGPRGARRFLLIDPDSQDAPRFTEDIRRTRNTWRELGASESSDTTTMAVSDLKRLIANEPALVRLEQEREIATIRYGTMPEELTATQTNNGIMLRWELRTTSAQDDTTGYRVFRRSDGESKFTRISDARDTWSMNMSYEDTTAVEPGVAYTYRVAAILKDDIYSRFNTAYGEYGGVAEVSITTAGARRTPTPTHTPTATPWAPGGCGAHVFPDPVSVEELILFADIVARVRLIEIDDHIATFQGRCVSGRCVSIHAPHLWYEFEVLEYLKGNGSATIWGMTAADGCPHTTEIADEARAVIEYLRRERDARWDDREAIVFLSNVGSEEVERSPSISHPDRYWLGGFLLGYGAVESHSLTSAGGWFPMSSSDGASGASGDQRFIIVDPDDSRGYKRINERAKRARNAWRKLWASGSSDMTTMSVSDLQRLIANEPELLRLEQEREIIQMRDRTAPKELTATQINGGIILRWKSRASYYTRTYRVFRRANNESQFTRISDVHPEVNMSYEDTTAAEPGVMYTYKVMAILNDDAYSRFGTAYGEYGGEAEVSITTAGAGQTPTPTPTATPTPGNSASGQ